MELVMERVRRDEEEGGQEGCATGCSTELPLAH